ncbi:MAG: four helix bundle protein [Candidatus Dojkabacteria bacterium]|nr:four helix bundle protein [Candidatus Dojkabacteria bacterium]
MGNKEFKEQFYNRCVAFTVDVIKFTNSLDLCYDYSGILKQLVNCVSSIGANFTEGNGAVSKIEFIKFMNHSRKSGLEGIYWFDVLIGSSLINNNFIKKAKELKKECDELVRILSKIILTSKNNT